MGKQQSKAGTGERPRLARNAAGRPQALDDEWKRWIAENLLIGAAPEQVTAALVKGGCPPMVARAEVARAQASPYLRGAGLLAQRLAKRDWLLGSYARLAAIDTARREVPRRERLAADAFFRDYYAAHRPVVLSGMIDHWPALDRTLDSLEARLGEVAVEVQQGGEASPAYEVEKDRHRATTPFSRFAALLREDRTTNDFYMTASNSGHNAHALAQLWSEFGELPGILRPSGGQDGFIWMGPRGTITPFHHDLTNNLLVQLQGRKRVWMVPSFETPRMRNVRHCFSAIGGPAALEALPEAERPLMLDVTIGPGEALFLPVGWWHHVEALDMTIGVSFTNFARDNDFFTGYTSWGAV